MSQSSAKSTRDQRRSPVSGKQIVNPRLVNFVIEQGRAIDAPGTIQPSGPFERALARLLIAAYKRRLRGIVEIAPTWVSEEILSASEHIGDDRAVLWVSEN